MGTAALALNRQYSGEHKDIRDLILTKLATSPEMAGPEATEKDLEQIGRASCRERV